MPLRPCLLALVTLLPLCASEATVHWDQPRQRIDGFGASDAWFADDIMTHPDRERMLDLLFDRERGAGLSILRHRVQAQPRQWTDHGMDLDSSDLDIGARALIGIRFAGLALAPGAELRSAHLQLSAKEAAEGGGTIPIRIEVADDAAPLGAEAGNLSRREASAETLQWQLAPWQADERAAAQRSPDLAPLLRAVLARPGWQSGNAICLLLPESPSLRKAWSADRDPAQAPELVIELADGTRLSARASAADDAEEEGLSDASWAAQLSAAAVERGCELVWAAAWSPPYAWKTSGDERNGFLKPEHYGDYAAHLEAYRARHDALSGVALYGISPQNEPGQKPWESCEWKPEEFRDFIRDHLRPTLDPACRIIAPEETRWNQIPRWYDPIHADPGASAAVDILAGHCYPKSDIDRDYSHYGKPIWMTEWSYDTSPEDMSIANGVRWAHHFHRLMVNAQVSACHHWWLVNFKDKQQGLISATRGPDATHHVAKRLWTIGNFSRFVRPGWQRIEATPEPHEQVSLSAFRAPDGSALAIVAINRGEAPQELSVRLDGVRCSAVTPYRTSAEEDLAELPAIAADQRFTTTLPGLSVTTFVGEVR